MTNNHYILLFTLFFIGLVSRFPFLEKMQSHWDGADYSIGVVRYSLEQHTPSPPGYPLYIAFGKFFNLFINDPHLSILLVSVLFSGLGAVIFYLTASRIFNRAVGLIAALLFLSGPTFYYFGITANPYGILPTTAALLVLVVYEIVIKRKIKGILLGIIFAIVIGIRPQDAFFLTPLFLYGLFFSDTKNRIKAIVVSVIVVISWLIPLLYDTGGILGYMKVLKEYSENALPVFSFLHLVKIWFILVKGLFLSFGVGCFFLLFYSKEILKLFRRHISLMSFFKNKLFILFFFWIVPSLLFNAFVRSDHAAHQMTYLSGILVLISYAIWESLKKYRIVLWLVVVGIILFNLFTFFRDRDPSLKKPYIPQSYHYSEIRKNDLRLKGKVSFIQQKFNPQKTLLISTEPLWRPYTYYLKTYPLTALNGLDSIDRPYKYNRYESINWNFHESVNKNFIIDVPVSVSTVVFLDDEAKLWIKKTNFKTYSLPANGSITAVLVLPKTKIIYNYHTIRVEK